MSAVDLLIERISLKCLQVGSEGKMPCIFDLEHALYSAAHKMGFEFVRYTCWQKDVSESGGNFPQSFSINFSNFPKAWEKHYEDKSYYLHDPVLKVIEDVIDAKQVISGTWLQAWVMMEKKESGHVLVRMQELSFDATQYGVVSGFYMVLVKGHSRYVISLGSGRTPEEVELQASQNLHQQVYALIVLLSQAIGLTQGCNQCTKSLRVQGEPSVQLTKKQRRVLEVFAEDASATNVEVAKKTHVSTETVAFHLKAVRRKFNQPNASGHALSNIATAHGLL